MARNISRNGSRNGSRSRSCKLIVPVGLLVALAMCAPVHSQDSPSLGDLARQNQKSKSATSSAKVLTNDDIGPAKASSPLGLATAGSAWPRPSDVSNPESAQGAIADVEAKMNELDAMDRATLIKVALQRQNATFPGRQAWENRLWDAKQNYVARGKNLVDQSRQILSRAQSLQNSQGGQPLKPDDPKIQSFVAQLKQLVQDATRADAAFQAVVMEGSDLAKQSPTK